MRVDLKCTKNLCIHASDFNEIFGWMDQRTAKKTRNRVDAAEEKVQLIIRNHTNATKSDEMFIDQIRIKNLCLSLLKFQNISHFQLILLIFVSIFVSVEIEKRSGKKNNNKNDKGTKTDDDKTVVEIDNT